MTIHINTQMSHLLFTYTRYDDINWLVYSKSSPIHNYFLLPSTCVTLSNESIAFGCYSILKEHLIIQR